MAGVKGRSGRTSGVTNAEVQQRLRIIRKAWAVLEQSLDDPNLDPREKREIAVKLCVKSIPTEISGELNTRITSMGTITQTVGEQVTKLEFNIGGADSPEDTERPEETPLPHYPV